PQAMATKGGGISYGGVSNRYNSFMINGMANNDMYGLSSSGTNGGLSNANPVALDAIEQLDVVVASYDVRMSGFNGGAINAITKSGTNDFRGSAYFYFNNQDFYGTTPGKDVAERKKLDEKTAQVYGVTLGGAVVKDKLFYFISGELNLDRSPSSYYLGYDGVALKEDELKRVESLMLNVGESRLLDVSLKENVEIEKIVVDGAGVNSADVKNQFSDKLISQLPSVSRSLYDVVRLVPQAMATKGGGISYGGVSNRYNSFMINGVANNDMYGLSSSGTHGGLSGANPVSLDAIEQLDGVVASYDVRMSGFGGGAINAIAKSGTNEFQGSAYSYFNNQNFYGTTPGRDVLQRKKLEDQTSQIYGVTLGGAVVKDKLFYFVSGEFNMRRSPSSYYWGYDGVALKKDELDRIAERYSALTGYDGGGVGRRDVERKSGSLMANLEWHINDRNRLSVSYSFLDASAEEYANSLSSFTFVGAGYANYSSAHHLALSLESRVADRVHNSLRVGFSRVEDGRSPDVEGDLPSVIIKNTGTTGGVTVNIGNNRYAGVNDLTQRIVTLTDDVIVDCGAHSLTVGM
ncbi:MAG: hypothetical protein J6U52_00110, partial [Alistipes sp.]|nr:hypothetical protein [Alistipes sp.]